LFAGLRRDRGSPDQPADRAERKAGQGHRLVPGGEVRLKDREKTFEAVAWDEAIDLEFTNTRPAVASIKIAPADVPTIFIAGDSTSTDQPREPFNSSGQMITRFFKPKSP